MSKAEYVEFSPDVATECGINSAIVLEAVAVLGDGATVANITAKCPYLGNSGRSVRIALKKLEEYGYIVGRFFGVPCKGRLYKLTERGRHSYVRGMSL